MNENEVINSLYPKTEQKVGLVASSAIGTGFFIGALRSPKRGEFDNVRSRPPPPHNSRYSIRSKHAVSPEID